MHKITFQLLPIWVVKDKTHILLKYSLAAISSLIDRRKKHMKKLLKVALPIILISVLLGSTTSRAAYGVIVGQAFDYEVVASSWDILVGTNSSSGTGFSFLNTTQAVGTQFEVEVTNVDTSGVNWNLTIGTDTETGSNAPFDIIGIVFMAVMPVLIVDGSPLIWNQTEMDQGTDIFELFFLEPIEFSETFNEMSQDEFITDVADPNWHFENVGGTFYTTTNIAVFEWHFDTTYTNNTDIFSGDHTLQIAFDESTGNLKGLYYDIDYSGILNGENIIYKIEQKFEEVGYNLPTITTIPEFEWFIALPVVAILSGIIVLRRLRT